ncbi:MAG: FGGY-family carbohydrate kinase [Lentisphaeria bacterium]|jgi:sugar (pentulose or hexulose) kinase|nr:FGGY-family carbohydrate kinase [Lentisphaeria bacterium]NLZ60784.1 rhamnulokinase [Lentisphaerota bacterium]
MKQFLAFDLGASSGRAILGTLQDGKISLQELHRFENGPLAINEGLYWNTLGLFKELKTGLQKALESGAQLSGIAIDTWGVDYLFLDKNKNLAGLARHYRDPRTDHIMPWCFERIPQKEVYQETGIQFMSLNSIFQLAASIRDEDQALKIADKLLFTPNALTWMLGGKACAEYSIATTSQLYNPSSKDWSWRIIDALGLPRSLFPEILPSCSMAGTLSPAIQEELKCGPIPLILVGSHDTASAVAAVPAPAHQSWAYLSSGTWSLLGVELEQPLINEKARLANYTNEGGVGGKIRFLKNIMGLWLIQECRQEWLRQGQSYSFDQLDQLAMQAEPFRSFIDPNHASFVAPGDMPARIQQYCKNTKQPLPESPGQIMRCALESLALRYQQTMLELEELLERKLEVLHLVGGGCKNKILNQFTANAIQRPVCTGPVEATALGNILGQCLATGAVKSLQEGRQIIKASSQTETWEPQNPQQWQQAYQKFCQLTESASS